MRIILLRLLLLVVVLFIQVSILEYIKIANARPNILLIIIIYFGFTTGMMSGQVTGFTAGFLEDLISYKYFGVNMLVKTIIGVISGNIYRRFFSETFLTIFLLVLILTFVENVFKTLVIDFFILSEFSWNIAINYFIDTLMIEMLLNGFIAPFIFNFLDRFNLFNNKEI